MDKLFRIGNRSQPPIAKISQGSNVGSPISEKVKAEQSLLKSDWTCQHEPYRYPIEEAPKDPWERCYDVVDKTDEGLCKDLKDEIAYLLVVASLFLAIVTAFTIESFKWLREDQEETTAQLLGEVVRLLNDTSARGTAQSRPRFEPNDHDIIVNQLWFLSMTLSLSAVVVGTLCLQWLSAFRCTDIKHKPHEDALALRQLRYEGLIGWAVPRIPAILLLTVQGALVLFAIGLLYLLWSVNRRVALPVAIVSGVSVVLLTLTTLMPLLQSVVAWIIPPTLAVPQCPYKSPLSWVVHRGCVLLAIILSFPFSWLPQFRKKMSEWRKQQLSLLTDYLWQGYDELWRHQRERWGPQSSKTGSDKYSYYLVRGLASAMETLVFQPSDVHIIHRCLQEFHGTSAEVEIFEELFSKDFPPSEEALLKSDYSSSVVASDTGNHSPANTFENLRKDFLNAHALQHFVAHNKKLHRTLLPHRVELYIRIKNSSQGLDSGDNQDKHDYLMHAPDLDYNQENQPIGSSIECPIQSLRDAQGLPLDLRIEFLKCVDRLIGTQMLGDADLLGTEFVLDASENEQSRSESKNDKDKRSIEGRLKQVVDGLKQIVEMLEKRLSPSSENDNQASVGQNDIPGSEHSPPLDHHPDPNHPVTDITVDGQNEPSLKQLCQTVRRKLSEYRSGLQKSGKCSTTSNPPGDESV